MKTILAAILLISLVSCSKSNPVINTNTTPSKVYIRIETVELNGESTYSPISVVSLK